MNVEWFLLVSTLFSLAFIGAATVAFVQARRARTLTLVEDDEEETA